MSVTADRATWLEQRRNGIGGSDVAPILGLDDYDSPWSIFCVKVGLVGPTDDNAAMKFGRYAEPMVAAWVRDEYGWYVGGEQTCFTHPDEPWMRCTIDGLIFDNETAALSGDPTAAIAVLEIKTSNESKKTWDEAVPLAYRVQAYWTLLITGHETVVFAVYHKTFGDPFSIHEFHRGDFDADDHALIVGTCERFWWEHCVAGVAPPTDGHEATTGALKAVYMTPDPDAIVDIKGRDDSLGFKVRRLANNKADLKQLEISIAADENAIKAALGDATTLTNGFDMKGRPVPLATWKSQPRTDLDRAALKAAHPDIYDQFTRTTQIRVLRLTKEPS